MNPFGADPLSVGPVVEPTLEAREYPKQKAWSISAVRSHATCPLKFRFIRIDRLPEPEQPGGPLERGKRIHSELAEYLLNGCWSPDATPLPDWEVTLTKMVMEGFQPEQQVAFTATWGQCGWYAPDVRARFIFDGIVPPHAGNDWTVNVVDWKTGRKYDTHIMDARLYALAALKMFPEAKRADVRFLYVDRSPNSGGIAYACERKVEAELEREADLFNHEFLNDTFYPARPGTHCRWCYQSKSAGGLCAFG
jgi:hypothetical protein